MPSNVHFASYRRMMSALIAANAGRHLAKHITGSTLTVDGGANA